MVTAGDERRHHAVVHVVVEGDKRARVPAGDWCRCRPVRVVLLVRRDGTRSVITVAASAVAAGRRRREETQIRRADDTRHTADRPNVCIRKQLANCENGKIYIMSTIHIKDWQDKQNKTIKVQYL